MEGEFEIILSFLSCRSISNYELWKAILPAYTAYVVGCIVVVVVVVVEAAPFGVHQLHEVAQIDLKLGQLTHPFDLALK